MFNIVLVEPEIPANTGNISRTCAVTGTALHLVRPLGFSVDDKHLKRAGLDYWSSLDLTYYDSFEEVEEKHPNARFFLASTHAEKKLFRSGVSRRRFSGLRERDRRAWRKASHEKERGCDPYPHEAGSALLEPLQFRCHRAV